MNDLTAPEILKELRETNKWLRVIAMPELKRRIASELSSPEEYHVYQASTGASTREVATTTKVSAATVQRMWVRWAAAGIVEETAVAGRIARLVDLRSLGIDVPGGALKPRDDAK